MTLFLVECSSCGFVGTPAFIRETAHEQARDHEAAQHRRTVTMSILVCECTYETLPERLG